MKEKCLSTLATLPFLAFLLAACVGIEPIPSQQPAVSATSGATTITPTVISSTAISNEESLATEAVSESATVTESASITESALVSITYELMNMTYHSAHTNDGTAPMIFGQYREQSAPGATSENSVMMMKEIIALGALNGEPAAAVILVANPADGGTFVDLAVVMEEDGEWVNVATVPLGESVIVNSVTIANNQISVDMMTHTSTDPICCPTQQVVQNYTLEGDELIQVSP